MNLAAPEDRPAFRVGHFALRPADHHAAQEAPVVEERFGRLKEAVVKELDERPELVGIALVRGGRQEEQVSSVMAKLFREAVVLGRLDLASVPDPAQVVGLIEDHEIPARCRQHPLQPGAALQRIDRGDDPVVMLPSGKVRVGKVDAEHLEAKTEAILQLALPVLDEAGGAHDQGPAHLPARDELADDHARLDGLAEPDLVGDQEPPAGRRHHVVGEKDLVGQKRGPAARQLAPRVRQGELERQLLEQEVLRWIEVAARQALPEIRRRHQPFHREGFQPPAVGALEGHVGLVDAARFPHAEDLAHPEVVPAVDSHVLADLDAFAHRVTTRSG